MNMDKYWSWFHQKLVKKTIYYFGKTPMPFIWCWFIFLVIEYFHSGYWYSVSWKVLSGNVSFQCYLSCNIFRVKHRSFHRSISKGWMWWDFAYICETYPKCITIPLITKTLGWCCGDGCEFSHAHEGFMLMPNNKQKKIQQNGLCKGRINTTYPLGSFVEIIMVFK